MKEKDGDKKGYYTPSKQCLALGTLDIRHWTLTCQIFRRKPYEAGFVAAKCSNTTLHPTNVVKLRKVASSR